MPPPTGDGQEAARSTQPTAGTLASTSRQSPANEARRRLTRWCLLWAGAAPVLCLTTDDSAREERDARLAPWRIYARVWSLVRDLSINILSGALISLVGAAAQRMRRRRAETDPTAVSDEAE
jgi:hypothetical protein